MSPLTDPRTGIVRALEPAVVPPHFPASFALTTARLADTSRFGGWASDPAGAGYAFADPEAVRAAALGEAVERYCGNLVPPGLVRASHDALRAAGRPALDPAGFAFFSAEQYARPGFPAVPMTADLVTEWAPGWDLADGDEVLVPAGPVWPSYHSPIGAPRGPLTNPVVQAGLAAGPNRAFAVDGALREVVERDAMTLSWYGGLGVRAVEVPRWLAAFAIGPQALLTTRFLALVSPFGMPVLGALVTDATTGLLSLGTGVHADPVTAALKAFAEALQLQLVLADYDDPAGAFAAAAVRPGSPLKPWRADRAYRSAYRPDLADAVDYACHLQLHLDPTVRADFEHELADRTIGRVALEELTGTGDLVAALTAAGHRAVAVDLTTADVGPLGYTVVRVLVPGLYSNAPIGLPFLGGERLGTARRSSPSAAPFPVPRTPLPH
ncbi:hypothetical protein GCM10009836_04120 [Pseudonocardia ailaonensis]|uniref:YcaO domain-containing protein n=1 Tax=Pseudonocardia ailaonensis TaxID=367279 RepID=A0ABN2MJG6_9PSEU